MRLAAVEFTGYAALWWKNIVDTRRMDGEAEIQTWQEMKRVLRKRFVPAHYKQELFMHLQTLRQGGKIVDEYIQEFEMLKIRSGAIEPPEQTMARFVSGLKYEIACIVELQWYDTLEDAMQLALKTERQRRSNPYKAANSRFGSSNKSYSSDIKAVEKSTVVTDVREDRNIADKGKGVFGGENKRETPGSSGGKTRQIKCFKCLGFGHIAA